MKSIKTRRPSSLAQLVAAAGLAGAGVLVSGCNDAQKGGLIGAGAGAGLGAIIGHQSGHGGEGALIGAGAGALGGYIIGNESDKSKHDRYDHYDY